MQIGVNSTEILRLWCSTLSLNISHKNPFPELQVYSEHFKILKVAKQIEILTTAFQPTESKVLLIHRSLVALTFSVVFSNTNIPCHTSSPRQDLTNPRAEKQTEKHSTNCKKDPISKTRRWTFIWKVEINFPHLLATPFENSQKP